MKFDLSVSTYLFTFGVSSSHQLDRDPGYIWRGKLGNALKHISCVAKPAECSDCTFAGACSYGQLFEHYTSPFADPAVRPTAPSPYLVSALHGRSLAAGDTIQVAVSLFGNANHYYPYVIAAMERVAWRGLAPESARLSLVAIAQLRANGMPHILFDGECRQPALPPSAIPIPEPLPFVRVTFDTPVRFMNKGKLIGVDEMDVGYWAQAVVRRVADISRNWCGGADDIGDALVAARECVTLDKGIHLEKGTRFSTRQKKDLSMNGITGSLITHLDEGIVHLWPALWAGQWLHVGKGAVMGMGQYSLALSDNFESLLSYQDDSGDECSVMTL